MKTTISGRARIGDPKTTGCLQDLAEREPHYTHCLLFGPIVPMSIAPQVAQFHPQVN